jgi:hypothetical protein
LAFSLHFPYEILAFGGGDGDTLHGRPFLLWLDGFGVFTMPQETVVCSIILCIYLDASNRESVRAMHALAKRLEKYGFEGDYLFVEANRRMLAEDTPGRRERDRETVEAWYRAQGRDRAAEVEGAREKLLAKLEARGSK